MWSGGTGCAQQGGGDAPSNVVSGALYALAAVTGGVAVPQLQHRLLTCQSV